VVPVVQVVQVVLAAPVAQVVLAVPAGCPETQVSRNVGITTVA
jgi:hypothetical protein